MNSTDWGSAARLVGYGCSATLRPTPGSDYRDLLDRYRTDTEFAEGVRTTAENLGLYVRGDTVLGLVVAGDPDGPFRVTLDNCGLPLRSGANRVVDRRVFGLVLVALAAYAYPNAEALVETTNPTVRPAELERFVTHQAEALADAASGEGLSDEMDEQLGEAALHWLDLPEVLPSDRGGYKKDCRRSYAIQTLSFLAETGRARRDPSLSDERGEAFVLNDRFRTGILEVAETLAFEIYARARKAEDTSAEEEVA